MCFGVIVPFGLIIEFDNVIKTHLKAPLSIRVNRDQHILAMALAPVVNIGLEVVKIVAVKRNAFAFLSIRSHTLVF